MVWMKCLQVFFLRFKATSYNNQEDPQQSSTLPRSLSTTKTISQHFNNMFKTNSYHRSLTKTTTALPKLPATPILPKPTFDKPKPAAGRRCNNIMTHGSCLRAVSLRSPSKQPVYMEDKSPSPAQPRSPGGFAPTQPRSQGASSPTQVKSLVGRNLYPVTKVATSPHNRNRLVGNLTQTMITQDI